MIKKIRLYVFFFYLLPFVFHLAQSENPIDRKALVTRHNVVITSFDSLSSLSVGNGELAFTVDATGMQTFPEHYEKGIPLGTQSQWAWHKFPNPYKYTFEETLREYDFNGKKVTYPVQWSEPERNRNAANWLRQNPHRLHLGIIGLELTGKDGKEIEINNIKNIRQELNLWSGEITSRFEIDNEIVEVKTVCHSELDMVSFHIESDLILEGRLKINFRFAYPAGEHTDMACDWNSPEKHKTIIETIDNKAIFQRILDEEKYFVSINWKGKAEFLEKEKHYFILSPSGNDTKFEMSCLFTNLPTGQAGEKKYEQLPDFSSTQENSNKHWQKFWTTGGAIDFSGSIDPRAIELERRIILSQYLMAIQCAGSLPPQETGLTYNSWFGKFHLEMHWWHGVHFALWNRIYLLEKSLNWYKKAFNSAKDIAERQGYDGIRWAKMTDPSGNDSPSSIGPFLIWQQPHIIYFAELCYREHKNIETLEKYKDLVFATADFMASFATYEKENDRYILGKGIIAAQERFNPEETFNTPLELAYWHWGLKTALDWCDRLNIDRNEKWENVLKKLSALPNKDGLYLAAESAQDSYTNERLMTDHPAVLGAFGMINGTDYIDTTIMKNTFNYVWDKWHWEETWGWDFPLTAMTAARLNIPEKAIDALFMNQKTNTYLVNGHNYQDDRLRLYLPGNGGLLSAVAMMCAGFEGNKIPNPGIPKNGKWKVRWENLKPIF